MSLYSGVTGKIEVKKGTAGSENAACYATFDVEITRNVAEAVCFGKSFKEKVPGILDWTASADGPADFSSEGQKDLFDALLDGAEVECTFSLDTTTFLKGSGVVESFSISHDAEGHATVSTSISGSGAISLTVPTET